MHTLLTYLIALARWLPLALLLPLTALAQDPSFTFTNNGTVKQLSFGYPANGNVAFGYSCYGEVYGGYGSGYIVEEYLDGALYATHKATGGGVDTYCTISSTQTSSGGWPGNWEMKVKYAPFSSTQEGVNYTQYGSSITSTQNACNASRVLPILSAYSSAYADHYYTYDSSQMNAAYSLGYLSTGTGFSTELYSNNRTVLMKRYYLYTPQTDHFMTADVSEQNTVTSFGYTDDGNISYVYGTQVPGTVPLYRYSFYDGSTGDLAHYYSTTQSPPSGLGYYSYEGIAAYVCG